MIAIIDYGVGNLFSLRSSLAYLGLESKITGDPDEIRAADKIILPGVGAFGDAMQKLVDTGLVPLIREEVQKKPLLGICLGMQLLFDESCEYGRHEGLGFVSGKIASLAEDLEDKSLKVPHIGWNALKIAKDDPLFKYVKDGEYVYTSTAFTARTAWSPPWPPANTASPSPALCGRAWCGAPSSTRKRAATPACVC